MRTASRWFVSALMLASVRGRALEDAVDDVHVDGHSSAQHDAAHYLVRDDGQVAPDVALPNLGSVRGIVEVSDQLKRPIYSYRGIPFAEAPVGELRFVAPVPKKAWDGVLDATKPGSICIQAPISALTRRRRRGVVEQAFAADEGNQSEDCLVLNVHTPKVNKTAKLPVLVYIHGGAFIVGSASISTPYGLLDEDVVLVSPQYRLGPIGYLNLQVDEVPGNAGLLDLVEALRWVNKNIEHFGGDPARVTVGGHSAGSASASLLYLSPLTKGLMHAVMPMSGSALAFWAWDHSPKGASESISFLIGCVGDQQAVVACLRSKTAEEIMASATLFTGLSLLSGRLGMSGITPSVQEAPNAVKVMPNNPEAMLTSFDLVALPYYTGVTKHEGTFLLELTDSAYLSPNNKKSDASFLRNDLIHVLLDITGFDDPGAFVADAFMQTYLDPNTLGDFAAMRDGIIDLMAAYAFKSPAQRIVQRNSELGQPSFLYAFNHNGALTQSSPEGIFHGADQPYIFPNGQVFTGDDLNVALTLRKLVVNFVTYHDPTPANSSVAVGGSSLTWPNYDRDLHNYMDMQWPFVSREGFLAELTVARREQFSAGGSTTTVMASSSSSASSAASTSKTALTTTGPTASTTSKTSVTSASPTAPTVSTTSKTAVTSTSSSASSAKTDKNAAAALSLSLAVQVAVATLVLGRVF